MLSPLVSKLQCSMVLCGEEEEGEEEETAFMDQQMVKIATFCEEPAQTHKL